MPRFSLLFAFLIVVTAHLVLTTGTVTAQEGHEGTPEPDFSLLWLIPSAIIGAAAGYAVFGRMRRRNRRAR